MATWQTATSSDGHVLDMFVAAPDGPAKAQILILQEIFGVNDHIQDVALRYARLGYHCLAPALFDRAEKSVSLGYDAPSREKGIQLKKQVDEVALNDVAACLKAGDQSLPRFIIGYCWGGSLAWRAALSMHGLAGAVAYYGGEVPGLAEHSAYCPVLAHFGTLDKGIPQDKVDAFHKARPEVAVHLYEADHGFNCDRRPQYNPSSAAQAQARTLAFLECLT